MIHNRTRKLLIGVLSVVALSIETRGERPALSDTADLQDAQLVGDLRIDDKMLRFFWSFDSEATVTPEEALRITELSQADWSTKLETIRVGLSHPMATSAVLSHASYFAKAVVALDPSGDLSEQLAKDILIPTIRSSDSDSECVRAAFDLLNYLRVPSGTRISLMMEWLKDDTHNISDLDSVLLDYAFQAEGQDSIDMATLLVDKVVSSPKDTDLNLVSTLETLAASLPPQQVGQLAHRIATQRSRESDLDAIRDLDNALERLVPHLSRQHVVELVQQLMNSLREEQDADSIAEDMVLLRRLSPGLSDADVGPLAKLCSSKLDDVTGVYPVNMAALLLAQLSARLEPAEVSPIHNAMAKRIAWETDVATRGVLLAAISELAVHLKLAERTAVAAVIFSKLDTLDEYRFAKVVEALGKLGATLSPSDRLRYASGIHDLTFIQKTSICTYPLKDALANLVEDLPLQEIEPIAAKLLAHIAESNHESESLPYDTLVVLARGMSPDQVWPFASDLVAKASSEEALYERKEYLDYLDSLAQQLTEDQARQLATPLIEQMQSEQDADMLVDLGNAVLILSKDLNDEELQPAISAIASRVQIEQICLGDLASLLGKFSDRWQPDAASSFVLGLVPRIRKERDDAELGILVNTVASHFDSLTPEDLQLICEAIVERIGDITNGIVLLQLAEADDGLSHLDQPQRQAAAEALLGSLAKAYFPDRLWSEYAEVEELTGLSPLLGEADLQSLVDVLKAPLLNENLVIGAVLDAISNKTGKRFDCVFEFVKWADSDPQAKDLGLDLTGAGPWAIIKATRRHEFPPIENLDIVQQGNTKVDAAIWSLCVKGNIAYLPAATRGLLLIDISNPANPHEVGRADAGPHAMAVDVVGTYAYVTAGPAGWPVSRLHIVDISNARAPQLISTIDLPDYPSGVAARDGMVYVADHTGGLRIIDVSDARHPKEVGSLPTPGFIADVILKGDYALLADNEVGLRVVDITVPKSPKQVALFETDGPCLDVTAHGNRAYLATGDSGIVVVDISDPKSPKEITNVPVEIAVNVMAFDDYVAVGAAKLGVFVLDVSDPEKPAAHRLSLSANGGGLFQRDDTLFVSDVSLGGGPYGSGDQTNLRLFRITTRENRINSKK